MKMKILKRVFFKNIKEIKRRIETTVDVISNIINL